MLGKLNPDWRHVKIVGGGAAGLFCAYALARKGYQISVFEKSDRFGGMLNTVETNYGIVEVAANSLVFTKELEQLCYDVNATLQSIAPGGNAKFILRGGSMRRFPLRLWEIPGLLSAFFFNRSNGATKTCREWGSLHLGSKATKFLIEPMITGVYGAAGHEIGIDLAFPSLAIPAGETAFSHLWKSRRKTSNQQKRKAVVVKEGMSFLITRLVNYLSELPNVSLHVNAPVHHINNESENIIIATPADQAAMILGQNDPMLAEALQRVRYTPMVSVGIFVEKKDLGKIPQGLGVLMPPSEQRKVLGILFTSSAFPDRVNQSDTCLLTIMMGGSHRPDLVDATDSVILQNITAELRDLFGFNGKVLQAIINRWPKAIPMYSQELRQIWNVAEARFCKDDGRILFGNYTGDVSLRGMLSSALKLS